MAYLEQPRSDHKVATIGVVAVLHGVAIYALVSGLAVKVFKETMPIFEARNIPVDVPSPPPRPQASPHQERRVEAPPPRLALPQPSGTSFALPVPLPVPQPLPLGNADPLPVPQPQPSFATRPARPRGAPGDWVGTDDYPARDLREGNEGVTRFSLQIGADGRPGSCLVTQSSGHPGLDEAACRNLMRKARFDPATDETGQRVAGSYAGAIRWQMPRD